MTNGVGTDQPYRPPHADESYRPYTDADDAAYAEYCASLAPAERNADALAELANERSIENRGHWASL